MDLQTTHTFSDLTPPAAAPSSRTQANNAPTPTSTPAPPPSGLPRQSKFTFKLPRDPKMKLLAILGIFVFILMVLSVVIPKRKPAPTNILPTPTYISQPTPAEVNNINLPSELKDPFLQIESLLNQPLFDLNPPEIDLNIGLQ